MCRETEIGRYYLCGQINGEKNLRKSAEEPALCPQGLGDFILTQELFCKLSSTHFHFPFICDRMGLGPKYK